MERSDRPRGARPGSGRAAGRAVRRAPGSRRRRRAAVLRSGALAGLALGLAACVQLDDFMAAVPIFAFMRDTPAIRPYEQAPRPAPPGSVPFASPAGDQPPPIPATEAALTAFGEVTPNPVEPTEEGLRVGGVLFQRHCFVCHGPAGRGQGPVIGPGLIPFVPDLTAATAVARTDGYLYGVVRVGRGLMPAYGDRISHLERWLIVNYMRQLQATAATAAAGDAAADDAAGAEGGGG